MERPDLPEQLDRPYGGQAEGLEQSEELLIEHASMPPDADRTADAFDLDDPGTDVDPADEVHSTEVVSDPGAGPDDPGQGPGITWER